MKSKADVMEIKLKNAAAIAAMARRVYEEDRQPAQKQDAELCRLYAHKLLDDFIDELKSIC